MPNMFQGRLVRLRAFESIDWEVNYEWDKDTEALRLTDSVWFPSSKARAQKWVEDEALRSAENDNFRFVVENNDGVMVGVINTHDCNLRCGTFKYGLAILPEHQRKGYASEAIRLVLGYFFRERRYQKVNVEVFSFNPPSIGLHEHLGFVQEGRLRRVIYSGGQYHDALLFGMTFEEFEAGMGQQ